jgi:CRISPR-associated protein Cmr6
MSILLLPDTRTALGPDAQACDSRSLFFDKFGDPTAKDSGTPPSRTLWFKRVIGLKPVPIKLDSWTRWLNDLGLTPNDLLLVKLQSRLMVNMAGGVMENAGLCLDRFGVPYIPGSAVKGCARRMAIQLLIEARETNQAVDVLARLLADVALVFGWSQDDWQPNKKSDFVYGVGVDKWAKVSRATGCFLVGADLKDPEDFGHFAGAVGFLPAYPRELPASDLELDVVTCHHPDYYQGNLSAATDTEEPNPVKFIAVAAGVTFVFVTLPLRDERDSFSRSGVRLHILARDWCRRGSDTFGIGAKTGAGYGWFEEARETQAPSSKTAPALSDVTAEKKGPAEHPLISRWRGHAIPDNFRVLLPELNTVESSEELRRVFEAIIPESERNRMRKDNRYWQSFTSRPQGQQILQRLGIALK